MDRIFISALAVDAVIGIYDWEAQGQAAPRD
jgi:dihydroneopterin aldolase